MKNFYVRKQISYLLTLLPHKWLKHIFGLLQWLPVCVYWSCAKNPKPQVTPRVSVFVISSTLSSGSLKGHYKPGKSMNDVMQTSHVAYCIARHSILTESTCSLFRGHYHCSTPKTKSCFMYTSLNEDKMQGKTRRQQIYYFKVLENRSEEGYLCSKLQKKQVGWGEIYGTLWDFNSGPVCIQPVLWKKQAVSWKIPCHNIIKVCSIIQVQKG